MNTKPFTEGENYADAVANSLKDNKLRLATVRDYLVKAWYAGFNAGRKSTPELVVLDTKVVKTIEDTNEIWKDVPGYEGIYQASNLGRVRSVKFKTPRIRRPYVNKYGYSICIISKNDKRETQAVHRLVLLAFKGKAPKDTVAAHLNGNPKDNRLENLVWVSQKENLSHRHLHGTDSSGEKNRCAKLTAQDVRAIRKLHKEGAHILDIAKELNIGREAVTRIVYTKGWKYVG